MQAGTKSLEKGVKYREEGNKLFQADKATEAVLFYNKSLSYCPHPGLEEFSQGPEQDRVKEVQFADQGRSWKEYQADTRKWIC